MQLLLFARLFGARAHERGARRRRPTASFLTVTCALAVMATLLGSRDARAQDTDGALVRCANRLDSVVLKSTRVTQRTAAVCLADAARDVRPAETLADCIEADTGGRIADVVAKLEDVDAALCAEKPSFGAADVDVLPAMMADETAALLVDVFGSDPLEIFQVTAGVPDDRRCVRSVARLIEDLRVALLRDYLACKKSVLHASAFDDPEALLACFDAASRTHKLLARRSGATNEVCAGVDRSSILPGACADASDLAACISARAACRTCRVESACDRLNADCDERDDGVNNESCAAAYEASCGNGVLDDGEQCDDGNTAGGDCCNATCTTAAPEGTACADDGNACTSERCDSLGRCAHASTCAWAFTDATAAAGITAVHAYDETALVNPELEYAVIAGGVAAGDYDADGWVDLYGVGGPESANYLLRNRGDGTFEERAAAAGVDLAGTLGSGPVFADMDGDGLLDLFVGGVNGTPISVFRNDGDGTFTDVTSTAGISVDHNVYGGGFGDYDQDGDLDLYLASWVRLVANTHRLWQNAGDGTFTDVTQTAGVDVSRDQYELDWSFTPNFSDIDNDGLVDLLVAGDFGTSLVFRNLGGGEFDDVTTSVIDDENGMGASPADYDNDGDLDWFVTSIFDPNGVPEGNWGVTGNRYYRNLGDGTFEDATDYAGVRDGGWGWASCAADFNLDGYLDIFHVNGFASDSADEYYFDASRLFISRGDGTFAERATELGLIDTDQGRGVACFDYDRDGDIDIFVSNNDQPARLWRNDAQTLGNNFLHVSVRGNGKNTEAVGARVYATIAPVTQLREIRAGSNFESQDPAIAHFGLGTAASVDELRVVWPDGAVVTLKDVTANQFLTVDHP